MFMFKTNQPIKVIHLQKLATQSNLNGPLVIEIVSNSFRESKKNFGRLIKLEIVFKYSLSLRELQVEKLVAGKRYP